MSKNRVNRKQKNSYSKIFTAIGNQQISNNPWTYHQLEESRTDIRKNPPSISIEVPIWPYPVKSRPI